MTATPKYGPRDAICVLMAAGRKVAWRDGAYHVDGKPVTAGLLNRLAEEVTDRPFAYTMPPTFSSSTDSANRERSQAA
jgi:hypothetical protein